MFLHASLARSTLLAQREWGHRGHRDVPQLLGKGNSQISHVPGAGEPGLLCLGQLPEAGKEI